MNKRLNEEYFKTRAKHKVGYKKRPLTFKKTLINSIIVIVLIYLSNLLFNYFAKRIEQNKKNDAHSSYIVYSNDRL
ncbi:conserved protein of unknown function [Tenacibaculum sp. 190130A14a]|uniref:Uncharacterized protein n=1 Tax=Tenacibaculum polynesiense TaxID=3137857 RepID=A0ABP1EZ02_9FLAO